MELVRVIVEDVVVVLGEIFTHHWLVGAVMAGPRCGAGSGAGSPELFDGFRLFAKSKSSEENAARGCSSIQIASNIASSHPLASSAFGS